MQTICDWNSGTSNKWQTPVLRLQVRYFLRASSASWRVRAGSPFLRLQRKCSTEFDGANNESSWRHLACWLSCSPPGYLAPPSAVRASTSWARWNVNPERVSLCNRGICAASQSDLNMYTVSKKLVKKISCGIYWSTYTYVFRLRCTYIQYVHTAWS